MQSVSSERKTNALVASFVNSPVGENIDWRLAATISPCHATVISSYMYILEHGPVDLSKIVTFDMARV